MRLFPLLFAAAVGGLTFFALMKKFRDNCVP